MRKLSIIIVAIAMSCVACTGSDNARYVNTFIGNAYHGHTFPGACVPFGNMQVSPESGNCAWRYCGGFHYEDDAILGFAQNHLNGTGIPDLGDILMLPFSDSIAEFRSRYDRERQYSTPGYYTVYLTDADVSVELTATERTSMHRYRYGNPEEARLLVDLQSGLVSKPKRFKNRVISASVDMPDSCTITGAHEVKAWVQRKFFYVVEFDHPYTVERVLPPNDGDKAPRYILRFDMQGDETLQSKVAISTVDIDGARKSLAMENPGWNFDKIRKAAYGKWNAILSRVEAEGDEEALTNFYTSLYHLCIQPNVISDTDGRYRNGKDEIAQAPDGVYYSTFSLWDTYRAAHPMYTILVPERVDGMINSMLEHYKVYGFLPIWSLWGIENYCMIGNHAIPVIVDAYLKGFRGFDVDLAYKAMYDSSTISHRNSDWETYEKYGYMPFDIRLKNSVSKTLETAYDDYCLALMANELGYDEDYVHFSKRADAYKCHYDSESGLMRGVDSHGNWRTPFKPLQLLNIGDVGDYVEGNAWQYTWHVQHDVKGLIDLMGGNDAYCDKLDELFSLEAPDSLTGSVVDVTGLIGQYAHGNEPCHHVIYTYAMAGRPWRTQELVREVLDRFYLAKPDGLCGNDDCGQMSAWYMFAAMGFYPVNPCGGEYVLGAPQLDRITLNLANGKRFEIRAYDLSRDNKYVERVLLNGNPVDGYSISHEDIVKGGLLEFYMTDKPVKKL